MVIDGDSSFWCACGWQLDPYWEFCPECGRYAGQVELEDQAPEFLVQAGQPTEGVLMLGNPGRRAISYRASIEPSTHVRLVGRAADAVGLGRQGLRVQVLGVPPDSEIPKLTLVTQDGPRLEADPWADPTERTHPAVPIRVRRVAAPRLQVAPQLLIFSEGRSVRKLRLENEGLTALDVALPPLPAGYAYADPEQREHHTLRLPPGTTLEVPVKTTTSTPQPPGTLTFRAGTDREPQTVTLVRLNQATRQTLPDYIVGIDFGTRNSSVYVRRVGRRGRPDEIYPVVLGDKDQSRFPSAMYKGLEGRWYFGQEAVDRATQEGHSDRLIRGVKTLIRERTEPYAGWGPDFNRHSLLVRFLGFLRKQTKEYILRRWGDDLDEVGVLYVCTLPVLRPGDQQHVREEMARAVRRALLPGQYQHEDLERWVRFAPEPVAAALYILLDRERVRIRHGHRIVVYDSGGGTTDVVVGRVELTGDNITLEEEEQFGVDRHGKTFGGEDVTHSLIGVLNDRERADLWTRFAQLPRVEAVIQAVSVRSAAAMLHEQVDTAKIGAVQGDTAAADLAHIVPLPSLWGEVPRTEQYVTQADVAAAVEPHLDGNLGPIEEALFKPQNAEPRFDPSDIDWIFPVGGNTLLPRLRLGLRRLFETPEEAADDRMVEMSGDEVMEAVARGAVYFPDARLRNAARYGLELVRTDQAGNPPIWSSPANSVLHLGRRRVPLDFGDGDIRLELRATVGDEQRVVECAQISRPEEGYRAVLLVEVASNQGAPILTAHYCIDPDGDPVPDDLLFSYEI